jgi:hypothetical protein
MKPGARAAIVTMMVLWCAWVGWALVSSGSGHSDAVRTESSAKSPVKGRSMPAAEDGLPEVPHIDLRSQGAEAAVAQVLEAPQANRWLAAFALGEQVGHHHGTDLGKAVQISEQLPESLRTVFFNGLGHSVPWDVVQIDQQVAEIQARVPAAYQDGVWIGVLIRFAYLHGGDPARVVGFAESFAELHGVDPVDGVRIGVQRRTGTAPAEALALIGRYPKSYQAAMSEELGWRVGSDLGLAPGRILSLSSVLEPESHGRFLHGVCRAGWNPSLSPATLGPLLQALDSDGQAQCLKAVAFAMAQAGWDAAQVAGAGDALGVSGASSLLVEVYQDFAGASHGWVNADLRPPER